MIELYYKSFVNSALGSSKWDSNTLYLYFSIFLFSFFAGFIVEKIKTKKIKKSEVVSVFLLLFFLLALTLGLRDTSVGIDTVNYIVNFNDVSKGNLLDSYQVEPGFILSQYLLSIITDSPHVAIFIYSSITVYLVLFVVYKNRINLNIICALAFYTGIFYFQAMNLLRIYLAASIIMLSFHFYINKKRIPSIVLFLVALSIHYSSLALLVSIAFYYAYKRSQIWTYVVFLSFALFCIMVSARFEEYLFIDRYSVYANNDTAEGSIGFMLFFEYLPAFICLFYANKYRINNNWKDLLVSLTATGFFFRLLAYYLPAGGRIQIHFMVLFIIVIPYFLNEIKKRNKQVYASLLLGFTLYVLIRLHFYFLSYLGRDGIMPYLIVS